MKMKKIVSGILALTATFACVGTFSACETSHPEVEMQISFQGETYTLEYKLYRKVAPVTVEHFLTLADNGYYDGLCVHDYADSRMYTGGYSYSSESTTDGGLVYKQYYEIVKNYDLAQTVFTSESKETPLYTLYGEFASNKFEVENGAKSEEFGSLSMFYTDKDTEQQVYLTHEEAGESSGRYYKYNSATSLFFISLTETAKNNSFYCTFATLDEDSVDTLKALQTAIAAYLEENDDGSKTVVVDVDEDDRFVGEYDNVEAYDVLSSPVVIEKVEVKKF